MNQTYRDAYNAAIHAGMSKEMAESFASGKVKKASALDDVILSIAKSPLDYDTDINYAIEKELDMSDGDEELKQSDDRERLREFNR